MVVFALTRCPGVMPQNFSAAYALAFCAGVYFPAKMAWWLPLSTLLVTDLLLNFLVYPQSGSGNLSSVTLMLCYLLPNYIAYGALVWFGKRFTAKSSWVGLLTGGLLGAVLFYFITNTAAWVIDSAYAKTLAGWIQALTLGTPGFPHTWEFFRNTLLSGGVFTGLFVGAMKAAQALDKDEEEEPAEEPAEAEPEESQA